MTNQGGRALGSLDSVDASTDGAVAEPPTDGRSGSSNDDAAEPKTGAGRELSDDNSRDTPPRQRRSIAIGVRPLLVGIVIALLVGAVGTLAWLYIGAQSKLDAQANEAASNSRAEKIALDYAVSAAAMDYKNLEAWQAKLVAGTTQELNGKLSEAANSMEQILVPLEWSSAAQPLVAKVRSRSDGDILVDCFVSVQTKTVQAPEALQSTATYSVTIDTNDNWQISDVGGIATALGPR